ncbi:MAG TPA: DNA mismatch repair endonuclease MutL [Ktedonobacteraceae bacterium]|nr:DNA mismatch repair endonuclease MutL [Ktedonobacteraceae bacterium]
MPVEVAERIAAGEVIERPVSVIKELLENALDAGARDIRVEVRGGGLSLLRVTDDGSGIPSQELEIACARHSTSKIREVEDLERLRTLGFRGEALASIAAVSELTLLSLANEAEAGDEESAGAYIIIRGGEVIQHGRKARLRGTTVTVRDLFYNVPARLKFMRHARTEGQHILQLLRRYAVGYPEVRLSLLLEEQTVLQTSGSGSLAKTLAEIYHLPLVEMLNPVSVNAWEGTTVRFTLRGCVGNRALAQNNRQHVTLFVNGRWIQSKSLQDALEAGYRGLLPRGKHPLLVLHIQIPTEEVDANVHPAKTEVRLLHEREVAEAISMALRGILERSPALPEEAQLPGPSLVFQGRLAGVRRRGLHVAESAEEYRVQEDAEAQGLAGAADILRVLHPLAQLQQAVILAEAPDGSLYLIDQHRAHERVIYEHLRQKYVGLKAPQEEVDEWLAGADAHLLLEPVVVELKRHEAELFEQRLPMLRGLGLECERFGGRSFLVRSVPGGVGQEQLASYLPELASIAAEDNNDWLDRLLIGLACRSALRRGRELGLAEQRTLLTSLAEVSAPAVCPHGSPILLHYSRAFLIDKFEW